MKGTLVGVWTWKKYSPGRSFVSLVHHLRGSVASSPSVLLELKWSWLGWIFRHGLIMPLEERCNSLVWSELERHVFRASWSTHDAGWLSDCLDRLTGPPLHGCGHVCVSCVCVCCGPHTHAVTRNGHPGYTPKSLKKAHSQEGNCRHTRQRLRD